MDRKGTGIERRENSLRIYFPWQGQVVRETWRDPDGKPYKPTAVNHKAAYKLLGTILEEIKLGTFDYAAHFPESPRAKAIVAEEAKGDITPVTFGGLADMWLKSKGQLSPASVDQYGTAVRFWKKLLGAETPWKSLTHTVLTAKIGAYKWRSATQHNNYMIALRGCMKLVYRGKLAVENPLIDVKNSKRGKTLPDPLTVAERDLMLTDLKKHCDERVYAYFLWQFFTGMRPEETIALRWSDIDWNHQTVRVQRVRTFKGSELTQTKTHVERDVDLLPQALQALKIMQPHTFMLRTERKGRDKDTAADIFQNPVTRKPWMSERPQRDAYWKPAMKRTGIRYRPAYNTRHTFATAALMTGAAPAYVAAQLGHSVKMLFEKYARWIPGNDAGTARRLLQAAMQAQMQAQEAGIEAGAAPPSQVDAETVLRAVAL